MYSDEDFNEINSFNDIGEIIKRIQIDLPYDPNEDVSASDSKSKIKSDINNYFLQLNNITSADNEQVNRLIRLIIEKVSKIDLNAALKLANLLISKAREYAPAWYLKGKVQFQLYKTRDFHNIQDLISAFSTAIELSKDDDKWHNITFWSYVHLGNVHLYRILTEVDAINHAFKYYNTAYRFARNHNIKKGETLIFKNIEILQKIVSSDFPLLVIIYDKNGFKIYEYLFQVIEVISEDQRLIPNFTALLSAIDDRFLEVFNSNISNAYLVIQNRLMAISTLQGGKDWVKVAMVFTYLQAPENTLKIEEHLLKIMDQFNNVLRQDDEIMNYVKEFDGGYDFDIDDKIEHYLQQTFSID